MDIGDFQQFKTPGSKVGKNVIGIMRSFGFSFSARFTRIGDIANKKYVVLFYNAENGGSIGFAFTNLEEAEGKFKVTHTESKTSGSVTCRSFFFNYGLEKKIEELAGRYEPREIAHPFFKKMYYIELNKKLAKS